MAVNIFQQGMDAFDSSYARTNKTYGDVANRKAGAALAQGDRTGAMQALGGEGDVGGVRTLQNDQQQEQRQQFQQDRQTAQDERAQGQDKGKAFLEALSHLQQVPVEQRRQALQHPVWQAFGITPDMVQGLKDEDLSDASLTQFGKDIEYQIVNRGGGGYDIIDKTHGKAVGGVAPDPKMVSVAGGATLYDPETRAPVYTAPKTFAPARARSGGGGGGRSPLGSMSNADLIKALRGN